MAEKCNGKSGVESQEKEPMTANTNVVSFDIIR